MKAKLLLGLALAGALNSTMAADMPKEQLLGLVSQAVERMCSEASLHKCLRVSKSTCLEKVRAAEKGCFKKYENQIPKEVHPSDSAGWALKLSICSGAIVRNKAVIDRSCFHKVVSERNLKYPPKKVEPNTMPDQSMAPFLKMGEHYEVVPLKGLGRPLRKGDVVVFKTPFLTKYVRRIIAAPGDHLELKPGLRVFINGQEALRNSIPKDDCRRMIAGVYGEALVKERQFECRFELTGGSKHLVWLRSTDGHDPLDYKKVIPDKYFFVLGDNRFSSKGDKYTYSYDNALLQSDEIVGIAKPAKGK